MIRDLFIPIGILLVMASIILPMPPVAMDFLLAANLLLALVLLVSALYISEPLKLSSLPTILLLATLYRLALNISTTRLVLSHGDAGQVVEVFGRVVAQGSLVVGLVVFAVITLVQFIVIAKGSERVAEVSARFTLDALPGKQMSIDADVRAGLIDFQTARDKRQELQTESRFYGALDGAMKFVKGDAIAGIAIALINMAGGLVTGIFVHDMGLAEAASRYTILTIGDGLVSQIPSLLNSLAAGMVVTRVCRGDGASLSHELIAQLGQFRKVRILIGLLSLGLALFSGFPAFPFVCLALLLLGSTLLKSSDAKAEGEKPQQLFQPKTPPLLQIELSPAAARAIRETGKLSEHIESFRQAVHSSLGLILLPPDVTVNQQLENGWTVKVRGVIAAKAETIEGQADCFAHILNMIHEILSRRAVEFVDDILTRRLLDAFDTEAPELVSTVVPGIVSVTQLTEVLKALIKEGVPVSNFDLILQAVAEHGARAAHTRQLLAEVRIALKRLICSRLATDGQLKGLVLEPALDALFARAEQEKEMVDAEQLDLVCNCLRESGEEVKVVLCSRMTRSFLAECLAIRGYHKAVLAFEELVDDLEFVNCGIIACQETQTRERVLERLAA